MSAPTSLLRRGEPTAPAEQHPLRIRSALSTFRHGRSDPTTRLESSGAAGVFHRATHTPDGPGTLVVRWSPTTKCERPTDLAVDADAAGPGAGWLLERVDSMTGLGDPGAPWLEHVEHPVVADAARRGRHLRIGRSDDLYHELLPTILEQRITAGAAVRQWAALCRELGEPAPGAVAGLRLPPAPDVLRRQPTWWFHPLGIERRRAQTLVEVARHADRLWSWSTLPAADVDQRLRLVRGVGVWTSGSVRGPALGDPDALCVGDYHAKNVVAWSLAGEPRGTDEQMIERLEPYVGQRGRVLRLLASAGHGAPKFGPRQRVLPMHRW